MTDLQAQLKNTLKKQLQNSLNVVYTPGSTLEELHDNLIDTFWVYAQQQPKLPSVYNFDSSIINDYIIIVFDTIFGAMTFTIDNDTVY